MVAEVNPLLQQGPAATYAVAASTYITAAGGERLPAAPPATATVTATTKAITLPPPNSLGEF